MNQLSGYESGYNLEAALAMRLAPAASTAERRGELLRAHAAQAYRAPYYRRLFDGLGLAPGELTLENLKDLPLTSRADLDLDPLGFQAVADELITDLALTSGTTGHPLTIPYTTRDLQRLAFNEMIGFYAAGVRPTDRFLLCVTLDRCFVAGLAYYSGLVMLGAAAIRSGAGQPARQWELIEQLKPTGIVGVPSFLLKLAEWARANGHRPNQAGIRTIVTIGEPVRKADHSLTNLGRDLTECWQAGIFSSYGGTEFETAFGECVAGCGGHIHPELMITEIVNEAGQPLPPGQAGEVVLTPLGVEGLPLIRLRTGDIARIDDTPCTCGWQTPRLGAIEGRLAQRLKFMGTTLYPEMIFQTLQEIRQVKGAYIEVRSAYDLSDDVQVVVGVDTDSISRELIVDILQSRLRVKPKVTLKPAAEVLAAMEKAGGRKPQKFFDLR